MKTSFYFVLWIVVYLLLFAFGGPWVQQNSFIVALALVWGISYMLTIMLRNQLEYARRRDATATCELVYCNDYRRYLGIFRRNFWFEFATFLYMLLATVFLVMIGENWFVICIFGAFAIGSAFRLKDTFRQYAEVKNAGRIELDENLWNLYEQYKATRDAGYQANQMILPATWKDKLLRCCDFVFAILSILIGIFFICLYMPGLLGHGAGLVGSLMFVLYGGLAFIYGISDLTTAITGYAPLPQS